MGWAAVQRLMQEKPGLSQSDARLGGAITRETKDIFLISHELPCKCCC